MLLANFRGTPEDAARAVEHAAQLVLDSHIRKLGSLIESKNQPVKVDLRDLEEFKQMLQKGNISTLQKGHQDYWSDERRQDHRLRSEKGGGCKVGPMAGQTLQDHTLKSEQGGACHDRPNSARPWCSYFPGCKGQTRVAFDGCQRRCRGH